MPGRALAAFLMLLAIFACFAAAPPAHAQPKFPALTGRIVDEAGLLSAVDEQELNASLAELEGKSSDQLVVYTTRSLQGYPIEDFGYQLGRAWGIGQQGTNNGVILIVAPSEREVRIEVGRGLEPQLTDVMTTLIIQNAILPAFRRKDFPAGIKAGVRDIHDVLLGDAEAVKDRARALQRRDAPNDEAIMTLFVIGFFVLFVLFVIFHQSRYSAQQARSGRMGRNRRASRDDSYPVFIPGGWGGGSGGGGGGGWGGGGGDFGGGGSSGSW